MNTFVTLPIIEEPEKVVGIYIEVYKEWKGINYFIKHELNK